MAALAGITSVVIGNVPPGAPANVAGTSGYGNAEGNRQSEAFDKFKVNSVTIQFGDGASTYPASGIPLATTGVQATVIPGTVSTTYGTGELATAVSFGYRAALKQLDIFDFSSGDGYVYKFDKSNLKIRIYQVGASGAVGSSGQLVEVTTAFVPASGVLLKGKALGR